MSTKLHHNLSQDECLALRDSLTLRAKERQAEHQLKTGRNVPIPESKDDDDLLLQIEHLAAYLSNPDLFSAVVSNPPTGATHPAAPVFAATHPSQTTPTTAQNSAPAVTAPVKKPSATDRARAARAMADVAARVAARSCKTATEKCIAAKKAVAETITTK